MFGKHRFSPVIWSVLMKDSHKSAKKSHPQKSKERRSLHRFLFFLVPLVLFLIFAALYSVNLSIEREVARTQLPKFASEFRLAPYPVHKQPYSPFISAESAVIMEERSKVMLFAKNPTFKFATASTAKIMTALVAMDYFRSDDVLTVRSEGVEGTVVGFQIGQQYYFEDVLYAMMLPSGNDAAYTIAENYPGGTEAFVQKMNEKAKKLRLLSTRYADPAGLNDEINRTTAKDLAILTSYAIQNPRFVSITSTREKIITSVDGLTVLYLENLNKLLGTQGVNGVKTGFTEGAGGVLVTSKKEDGHTFIIVVMKSQDRFLDTQALLTLLTGNVLYFQPEFQLLGN